MPVSAKACSGEVANRFNIEAISETCFKRLGALVEKHRYTTSVAPETQPLHDPQPGPDVLSLEHAAAA